MKRLLLLFTMIGSLSAQSVSVTQNQMLFDGSIPYANPCFSPDGNKLLITSPSQRGLQLYDFDNKKLTILNELTAAGVSAAFINNDEILFRADVQTSPEKVHKRLFQIYKQSLNSRVIEAVTEPGRDVSQLSRIGSKLTFSTQAGLSLLNEKGEIITASKSTDPLIIATGTEAITVVMNGQWRELKPLGEGHYLWISLSPDLDKILFTKAGEGTFICDLDGSIITSAGYLNAPKWSPNGQWIAGMKDEDDGVVITQSEIAVFNISKQQETILTNTKILHEMDPDWSPSGNEIAYDTADGKIGILQLQIHGGEQ